MSYWPRPPELVPYCKGEQDETKCVIYSYLRERPDEVNSLTRSGKYRIKQVIGLPITLGFGLYNVLSSVGTHGPLSKPYGAIELILASILLADGFTETFAKKHIFNYIKDFRKRNGTDEVYDRIFSMCENIGNESDYFWEEDTSKEEKFGAVLGGNFNMNNLAFTVFDIKGMKTGPTNFRLGKMRVSYDLTDNFEIHVDKNIGVVLTTSYGRDDIANDKIRGLLPETMYFSQGLLFPIMKGRDFRMGTGFGNCTEPLGILETFPDQTIDTIKDSGLIRAEEWFDSGDMFSVFRDRGIVEQTARKMLPRNAQEDAIRIQRVIQEAIASDY